MPTAAPIPESTLLATTLCRLMDDGLLDARAASECTGLDASTIRRWAGGATVPTAHGLSLLVRHHPSDQVALAVVRAFAGPRFRVLIVEAGDAGGPDLNGDGKVDLHDALLSIGHAIATAAGGVLKLHDDLKNDMAVTDAEADAYYAMADEVITHCDDLKRVVHALHKREAERRDRRRKARPLPVPEP
jgi:hypothetical protein